MYGTTIRSRHTVAQLEKLVNCPASITTPRSDRENSSTSPNLFRWIAVRDAILHWHDSCATDPLADAIDTVFGALHEPHRSICIGHLEAYVRAADREDDVQQTSDPIVYVASGGHLEIAAWPTLVVARKQGLELVKLRTGKSSVTSIEEASVLTSGSLDDHTQVDISEVIEMRLAADDVVKIEVSDDDRDRNLSCLVDAWERLDANRRAAAIDTRPGQWCYLCDRLPFCGEYPPLVSGPISTSNRVVKVSKTSLGYLPSCERRAGWKVVHQIPGEREFDSGFGDLAHRVLAGVVGFDNPSKVFEKSVSGLEPSSVADLRAIVEAHESIERSEHQAPRAYEPEKELGWVTVVDGLDPNSGNEAEVTVAMMARADGVSSEHGVSVVIDHKTSEHVVPLERELLAVSLAARFKARRVEFQSIEIHYHFLRRADGERCDVRVFERADLNDAVKALRDAAQRFAGLDPFQPLIPAAKEERDSECGFCEFSGNCARWGGPVATAKTGGMDASTGLLEGTR